MEQLRTRKKPEAKTLLRVLAVVLAVALLMTALLAGLSGIRFDEEAYRESALEEVAAYLSDSTEYMDASLGKRMYETLAEAVGTPRTYDDYYMYASVAIAQADYEKATGYIDGCIRLTASAPQRSELYVKLGCLYALLENWQRALTEFTAAILLNDGNATAYLMRAQSYAQMNDGGATLKDLEAYRALAGDELSLMKAMGNLYQAESRYEEAVDCYSKLLSDEASEYYDIDCYADRAQCYAMLGRNEEALADCRAYMAAGGTDADGQVRAVRGICAMSAGEYAEAVEMFADAVESGYAYPATLYAQSVLCHYILGDYDAVIENGERALALAEADETVVLFSGDPGADRAEILQWLGLAYLAKADYETALTYFDECKAQSPDFPDLSYYRGVCCGELGRTEEAALAYTDSIERGESLSLCYYNRAVLSLNGEDFYAAAEDLLQVISLNEDTEIVEAAVQLLSTFVELETAEIPENQTIE